MSFLNVNIKKEYRVPGTDIINEFYIPLLKEAVLYQRSVAYFSSSSLIDISYGLANLISNNGKVQLIVSPILSDEDIDAINKGYEAREDIIEQALLKYITEPRNYFEEERLNLLANLIASGNLDIKVAYSLNKNNQFGLYHEKLGIMHDKSKNIIAFSGSMNETENAFVNNYETIDVFTSWNDEERVEYKLDSFEKLWNDADLNARVFDFPEAPKNKLLSYKKDNVKWDIDFEEFASKGLGQNSQEEIIGPHVPVELHEYQKRAIENWKEHNYVGIFDMATGTGKTFTGLGAITKLYNDLNGKIAVFIVCPLQHLVNQWVEDIEYFNIHPIIGHSESVQKDYRTRLKNAVFDYNIGVTDFFCFVCTNSTFSAPDIQEQISKIKGDVLLVVDEAHNFGSSSLQKTLDDRFKYRLALSATFDRHGDEYGTKVLYDFFKNKCIEFSLDDAIMGGFLTPYKYYPILVNLTSDELEKYHEISKEIARCIIKKDGKIKLSSRGEMLALQRSRLVAGAYNKIPILAREIKPYINDKNILVYCGATKVEEYDDYTGEDMRQIDAITTLLGKEMNMSVAQFTSRENNQTRNLLKEKYSDGTDLQVLVAIKCLDEGVNIPSIKTAFILASTRNPKEYIQRRGRVLRKFKGKDYAEIYDFITLPRSLDEAINLTSEEIRSEKSLVRNELNRIIEFKRIAMNSMDSDKLIEDIKDSYHLLENDDDLLEMEDGNYE